MKLRKFLYEIFSFGSSSVLTAARKNVSAEEAEEERSDQLTMESFSICKRSALNLDFYELLLSAMKSSSAPILITSIINLPPSPLPALECR